MKKSLIIVAALICLFASSCGIPSVVLDTTYKGSRIVLTNNINLFAFDGGTMTAALGAKISGRDTVLAVMVTYNGDTKQGIFDKEDCIRVRLANGEEFSSRNLYDKEFEHSESVQTTSTPVNDWGYAYAYSPYMDDIYLRPVTVTRWVPQVYTVKESISTGLYPITKKQLFDLMKVGVEKFRIESAIGDADMPDPSGLSETFADIYKCLHNTAKKKKSADF